MPSGVGVEMWVYDSATNTNSGAQRGLVDKCMRNKGADPDSCKIRPGYHSYIGSITSYVQRTAWDGATGAPTANVTIASAHVDTGTGSENVLLVTPNAAAISSASSADTAQGCAQAFSSS